MGIVLVRVDERLVHGQVTMGWGSRLRPARYVVVDDELAGSAWEQELYRLATPAEVACEFVTVDQARARMGAWCDTSESILILAREIEPVLRLARGGLLRGRDVNLGGLHHRPGRTEVARYLFLDQDDRARIRELGDEGVRVWGQDLPGSPRIEATALVS